ncbi:MAG: elongation factor 1-beta [Thermoplasmata archaeon]|jgi:elongation factor 1-beta|nr:elongation factor 1-beta [Thermoplasmatales archaeon]PMP74313.1 MAG: elongation factor 1-beta [Aciduliprofundum sp.]
MGEVGIVYKILPEDVELDVNDLSKRIEEEIRGICNVKGVQIKPIAFGLNAILMFVSVKDESGASDRVEQKIKGVKGVGEIEVEEMSLL